MLDFKDICYCNYVISASGLSDIQLKTQSITTYLGFEIGNW